MEKSYVLGFKPFQSLDIKDLLPRREKDCPAIPICMIFGNAYESCRGHGEPLKLQEMGKCIATVILLLGKKEGLWPQGMEAQIADQIQKIGFALGGSGKLPSQKDKNE